MPSFRQFLLVNLMLGLLVVLAACRQETVEVTRIVPQEVTRVVTETVLQEGEEVEVTRVVTEQIVATPGSQEEAITLDITSTTDIPTLDPQVASDGASITYVENIFVQLTNFDPGRAEIVPEAATDWEISEDALVYTFHLRPDIPWVYHNPVTGETSQVTDTEGNPRFVTAEDFAFGIRRACDPAIGSYYSGVVAPLIAGCQEVLNYQGSGAVPQELTEAIGVKAADPFTLIVELAFPAAYFLSMTHMWTLSATPGWTIEEHGEEWIEAGNIVTNGRYVLEGWVHGVRRSLLRNPHMPQDMWGRGNIGRVVSDIVPDDGTSYALWLNNEVDLAPIPSGEFQAHLEAFPDETYQHAQLAVRFIAFRHTKEPFDDARVRRAFAAAYDRQAHIAAISNGLGSPMKHFAPPGVFGAPPIDEVGVGYDPQYAREQLVAAGYPDCQGFPTVTLLAYSGPDTLNWIEFAQGQWQENLGCSAGLIQIEQLPFAGLLASIRGDRPDAEAPHMWTLGWGSDYPDENNWVGDVLWCENEENLLKRPCTEIDDLIVEAREEPDPKRRVELYRQIEEGLFGKRGEMPIIPIQLIVAVGAVHDWVESHFPFLGGRRYYEFSIDWEAKQAAQE